MYNDQAELFQQTLVFSVSEFNEAINQHLSLLGEVVVEGEISRWDVKSGRLIFATIKDSNSAVDIFSLSHMVKNYRQFEPGMKVKVWGTAGLYKGSSKFRLFINQIVPEGEGALQIALEKLRAQLEAEGLFAPERKRPLPLWPTKIGLITAKDSSAYHDLVKILSARMSGLTLKLLPVSVQGREAIPSILKAFRYINQHSSDFDLVIMARGGGSLEDLAAFNSEEICRSIYAAKVPVISAIGHEDNWSLTDYVADLRASTPSNAAELAVKDKREVITSIHNQISAIYRRLTRETHQRQSQMHRSISTIQRQVTQLLRSVSATVHRLSNLILASQKQIEHQRHQVIRSLQILKHQLQTAILLKNQQLSNLQRLLTSLDYRQVLKRGYSITKTQDGTIIKNPQTLRSNDSITTIFAKGSVTSVVKKGD